MSRRKVRLFFCLLLVAVLGVHGLQRRQVIVAAAPMVFDQYAPPQTHSFYVPNAPAIVGWPSAKALFYAAGRPYPTDVPEAYFDPSFNLTMLRLRSSIIASAKRHNRQAITKLTDDQFAVLIAAQLYFEYNSALATRGSFGRAVTPVYQEAQGVANSLGLGNFSVWPANLRPSVGLSLLNGEMPYVNSLNEPTNRPIPIAIFGSDVQARMQRYSDWQPSETEVAAEISDPFLAVEYLAANFEVASYRAEHDWVTVNWMTFVAWHNQGLVSPGHISNNGQLANVLPTFERYIPGAMALIYTPPDFVPGIVRQPIAK